MKITFQNFLRVSFAALILTIIFAGSSAVDAAQTTATAAAAPSNGTAYVPGELIVKLRSTAAPDATFLNKHALASTTKTDTSKLRGAVKAAFDKRGIGRIYKAKLKTGANFETELAKLKSDSMVEYAEPNYTVTAAAAPNDTLYPQMWALNNTGQTGGTADADIDAPEGWDAAHDSSVVVGVIDTGIDYNHPDLAQNMWHNPGEVAGNGVDDDGNGYVDDVYGWNFVSNTNNVLDDFGHGTHVAGTIAARGNNTLGTVGINWSGKVAALKFLASNGSGTVTDAVKAIQYATAMGFKVTNNSWGGGGYSQALYDVIAAANDAGALFVASAGNEGGNSDSFAVYPAAYDLPNIISVAATDHVDALATFSNYGAQTVDLGAPGVSIYSTVPTGTCTLCTPGGFATLSGTSMAAPHVAGAAALLWGYLPNLTAAQIKAQLMTFTDPVESLVGKVQSGGRLNIGALLTDIGDTAPPSAIADLAVTSSSASPVLLTWTAVGDDGMAGTATRYDIRYATSPITAANFASLPRAFGPKPGPSGTHETYSMQGLLPGTTYYFAIKAVDNRANAGPISNVVSVTTAAASITLTSPNGGEQWETTVTYPVTWSPVSTNPAINTTKDVQAYLEQKDASGAYTTLGEVRGAGTTNIQWSAGAVFGANTPPPGQYYIRLVNNANGTTDRSDAPFTLLARPVELTVNGVRGQVLLYIGLQTTTVAWSGHGVSNCALIYAINGDPQQVSVANSGSMQVALDPLATPSVRILCSHVATGQQIGDIVGLAKVTTTPSLRLLGPNGGESVPMSSSSLITWQGQGLTGMSIALYKNDQHLLWIDQNVPSTLVASGSYPWTPGSVSGLPADAVSAGNVFKIVVTGQKAASTATITDSSDAPFGFGSGSALPTCSVNYAPATVYPGVSLVVNWFSSGATSRTYTIYRDGALYAGPFSATLSGTITDTQFPAAAPVGTYTRKDTVTGPGGTGTCEGTLKVTVVPPSCTITATPAAIKPGEHTTLSWTTSANIAQARLSPWGASGPGSWLNVVDQSSVQFDYPTTYTLSLTDTAGNTGSCNVDVTVFTAPSPTVAIWPDTATIQTGQSTTIHATYAAAAGDTITNTTINIGTASVIPYAADTHRMYTFAPTTPGDVTFTAYAQTQALPQWTAYKTVTVHVNQGPPPPSCAQSFGPASITVGQSSTNSWSSQNADSMTLHITQGAASVIGPGATGPNGSFAFTPSAPGTYVSTRTAVGPGGTASCSAALTVSPLPTPSCTTSFSPTSITLGQSSTNSWSAQNVDSMTLHITQGGASVIGPGATGLSGSFPFTPGAPGTYVATRTVTGYGATAICQDTLTVGPVASLQSASSQVLASARSFFTSILSPVWVR